MSIDIQPEHSERRLAAPLLTAPNLTAEREKRGDTLDFAKWQERINVWLKERPLLRHSDSNKHKVAKLIAGEVKELLSELEKAKSRPDFRDVFKEAVDIIFFCFGFLVSNELDADFAEVRRKMNGWDDSQRTWEYLISQASFVEGVDPVVAIEHLTTVWASALVKLEHWFELSPILTEVLKKNSANYPREYFVFSYMVGKEMVEFGPDEADQAFDHRVRCLRTIRSVVKLARPGDPIMRHSDHQGYADLIVNHRDTDGFQKLCWKLAHDYQLPLALVIGEDLRPHRLVSGILKPGQELDVLSGSVSLVGSQPNGIQ